MSENQRELNMAHILWKNFSVDLQYYILKKEKVLTKPKKNKRSCQAVSERCRMVVPRISTHSLATLTMERNKAQQRNTENHVEMRFTVPISNRCERLFSMARKLCTDCLKSMSPVHFQHILRLS